MALPGDKRTLGEQVWDRRGFLKLSSLACLAVAAGRGQAGEDGKSPLAGLPSAAGKHIGKIKALADNTWLSLGPPAADPKWGKGRGRSWSARMAYASDLRAAFLFGEGVHAWWNKQNHRYMDDLFVYDIMAHRWICAYPGTDVMNVKLKLDSNRFEIDGNGRPLPVAQLGHAYEQVTYDTDRKRFLFMPGASQDWQSSPFGKRRLAWGVKGQGIASRSSPWMYDVRSGRWAIRKVDGPFPSRGATPLGATLIYVPAMKKTFFWDATPAEAWLYDPRKNAWARRKPKGPAPAGIDKVACLDSKRGRIYMGSDKGLWCYDLKANAFLDLQPKGKPPRTSDGYIYGPYSTSRAVMNYDAANDVAVLFYHDNVGPNTTARKERGVFVYDPAANTWGKAPLPVPREFCKCPSSFYDPVLNAHFIHCAGDSADDGVMLVYRYKKVPGKIRRSKRP
jgi:hypothetical protein